MFDIEVSHLNNTWKYRYDKDQYGKKDHWKVMKSLLMKEIVKTIL